MAQFQTFTSSVDISFWSELCNRKLEKIQLNEAPISITGCYRIQLTTSQKTSNLDFPALFLLERNSFDETLDEQKYTTHSPGTLFLTNTVEGFKELDKKSLFNQASGQIWKDILDGSALKEPSKLTRFILLCFADIKQYKFYFWFAFPALSFPSELTISPSEATHFSEQLMKEIESQMEAMKYPPFFLIKKNSKDQTIQITTLTQFDSSVIMFGFLDPSSLASYPGWPLRNFLMLIHQQFKLPQIQVFCYREKSIILNVTFPKEEMSTTQLPPSLGWETWKGKLQPRFVNLGSTMDPKKLAANSVDLNLKLMKWRLLPSLDLTILSTTKCLLLGSGTLGCNVARLLMGWGIRNITLVDNGKVSFSNPARQTLFEFEDCLNGGKPKAEAAAARLKAIFPDMNAVGINLSIPMPGHAVGKEEEENVKTSFELLSDLIDKHDAVFVLMDSRESRWLPTVLCAAKQKLLINIALGFDSFLVLRHGIYNSKTSLGCYFCNDVVAPQNSLRDRTLDQQCTVTRPGLSPIAAALGVELLISLLQHPLKGEAPADTKESTNTVSPLGLIPHSIRGFMSQLNQVLIVGHAYNKCTACSKIVVETFKEKGFNFLLHVFNHPSYLEDLTGITQTMMEESKIEFDVEEEEFEI